jgi:hypothetical protein
MPRSSLVISVVRSVDKAVVTAGKSSLAALRPEAQPVERALNAAADFVCKPQRGTLRNESNGRPQRIAYVIEDRGGIDGASGRGDRE